MTRGRCHANDAPPCSRPKAQACCRRSSKASFMVSNTFRVIFELTVHHVSGISLPLFMLGGWTLLRGRSRRQVNWWILSAGVGLLVISTTVSEHTSSDIVQLSYCICRMWRSAYLDCTKDFSPVVLACPEDRKNTSPTSHSVHT